MDEFIFDDELEEVGAEIEAHCPRCRLDTSHVVVTKYEDEVRRVQCSVCSETHSFRKPRGDAEDELEPKKKAARPKPTWEQVMQKSKKTPRAYSVSDSYGELDIVDHPKFGKGYVTDHLGLDKIEVTFQSEVRVLIHNRKNLNLPLLQSGTPATMDRKRSSGRARPTASKAARPAKTEKKAKPAKTASKAKPRPQASKSKRSVTTSKSKKSPKAKKATTAKRKK